MQRLQRYASSWGLDLRDLVLISALAIVAILPVSHDIERASNAGPLARVAMSWEIVNHRALEERTLPLWNPYQFGGRPHLANPEMLALYPPHMRGRVSRRRNRGRHRRFRNRERRRVAASLFSTRRSTRRDLGSEPRPRQRQARVLVARHNRFGAHGAQPRWCRGDGQRPCGHDAHRSRRAGADPDVDRLGEFLRCAGRVGRPGQDIDVSGRRSQLSIGSDDQP